METENVEKITVLMQIFIHHWNGKNKEKKTNNTKLN